MEYHRPDVTLGEFAVIEEGCKVGTQCYIGNGCVLKKGTVIGNNTTIGHLTVFEGQCSVGDRCLIHTHCHITRGVTIGDDVFIASNCMTTNDRRMCHNRRHVMEYVPQAIVIKRGVRIGANVTILGGVEVGENAVIGAGSVVTKDIPPGRIAYGSPARVRGVVAKEEWL